eukprot:TRINITY_DN70887_c0_g1_i1.p1 TRINITY_DN70887_c0_g1~~TRINITY_DN70887_c0_g1_i1.p1  ORF type:complete len:167 (-),score=10.90 TRINITY_DN70887_c0_g1_i1:499-999(-)
MSSYVVVTPAVTVSPAMHYEQIRRTQTQVRSTTASGSNALASRDVQHKRAPWDGVDAKTLCMLYLLTIFICRVSLRTCAAEALHWAIIMLLEDGMSLMTFGLAFGYLVRSDGAPLTAIAKCFSPTTAVAIQEAAVRARNGASDEISGLAGGPIVDQRLLKFYYFGL